VAELEYDTILLDIIILVSSTMFQNYDIILCDCSYIPLHQFRKKKKIKKENQFKKNR